MVFCAGGSLLRGLRSEMLISVPRVLPCQGVHVQASFSLLCSPFCADQHRRTLPLQPSSAAGWWDQWHFQSVRRVLLFLCMGVCMYACTHFFSVVPLPRGRRRGLLQVIKGLRKHTKALLDAHLMVTHPAQWVDDMAAAGVDRRVLSLQCVCLCCVCVCRPISYCIMHIQTMHPKTHRATYILARGLMNADNPVGPSAVSRLSPSLHSRYSSMIFFSQGGQPILIPSSPNRPLGAYLLGEASKLPRQIHQHSCVPSLHLSLLGFSVHQWRTM